MGVVRRGGLCDLECMASSRAILLVAASLLVACGDDSSPGGVAETDTDTDGTTGPSTSDNPTTGAETSTGVESTTTVDPSTSSTSEAVDGSSSSTGGPTDEPPDVTLMVAGETNPETLAGADRIPLVAEATDDSAVDRVEFYRDGELIATDDEAPYETEVLLTSLDNATIQFSATAYDDAEQSDESSVSLEVDIIGANIVHVATDVLEAGGLAYAPGGGVAVAEDGSVLVTTSTLDADTNAFGLRAARVSADLSEIDWNVRVPAEPVADGEQILGTGEPVLLESAGRLFMTGTTFSPSAEVYATTIISVPLDGLPPSVPYEQDGLDDASFNIPGLVRGPGNDIILHGPGDTLSRVAAGAAVWQVPTVGFTISDLGATHMSSDANGDVLLDSLECAGDPCNWTIRKILAEDGSEAWQQTVPADVDLSDFHVGASVTAPNGDAILAFGLSPAAGGDIRIIRWDADGNQIDTFDLDSGDTSLTVSDVEVDEQGQLVLLGSRVGEDSIDANLIRMAPDGTQLWSRSFGFGTERDLSLAFTLDSRGRVVMAGLADPQAGFLVFAASLWLAIVDL